VLSIGDLVLMSSKERRDYKDELVRNLQVQPPKTILTIFRMRNLAILAYNGPFPIRDSSPLLLNGVWNPANYMFSDIRYSRTYFVL
jgi:hypothetical protein